MRGHQKIWARPQSLISRDNYCFMIIGNNERLTFCVLFVNFLLFSWLVSVSLSQSGNSCILLTSILKGSQIVLRSYLAILTLLLEVYSNFLYFKKKFKWWNGLLLWKTEAWAFLSFQKERKALGHKSGGSPQQLAPHVWFGIFKAVYSFNSAQFLNVYFSSQDQTVSVSARDCS